MKPSIQLKLGQQLTMTPQLQQAIRLLQLSTLDLHTEIQEALETNSMLELEDDQQESSEGGADDEPQNMDEAVQELDLDRVNSDSVIPDELPVDSAWDDIYDMPVGYGSGGGAEGENYTNLGQTRESLQDRLLWQARLSHFSDRDMTIASTLIDAIDDDGYLRTSLEDVKASVGPELGPEAVELDEIEAVLHRVQTFEPVGVGARDVGECLLLQLRQMPPETPWREQAIAILTGHIRLLEQRDYNQLMRRMKLDNGELREVLDLIQSTNPRPGGEISATETQYVVPDVVVRKLQDSWVVELNPHAAPRLRLNPYYTSLVKRADNSRDNGFLRNQLQEARWLLKSIQSRNETLLKVATCIVEHQRGFLEYGEEAMKPLVLNDIARVVDMHESTISRVTTQKYMYTPRGIFELKYFFSSHVGTASGGERSSTAIRALIKKLIAAENAGKPLSDNKIARLLVEQGVNVARRTVAKYRESMAIPPSNERKRLM